MSSGIPSSPSPLPAVSPSPSSAAIPSTPASNPPAASPGPSATQMPGTSANPPSSGAGGCQNCGGKNSGKGKKQKRGGGLFRGLFGLIGGFFKMLFGGKCSKKPKQNTDKN